MGFDFNFSLHHKNQYIQQEKPYIVMNIIYIYHWFSKCKEEYYHQIRCKAKGSQGH